jgi:D-arginine dehydrogenase
MQTTDPIVIVGGGIAGAACAYSLAQRGARVIVIERDPTPGNRSTGRNAAILRTWIPDLILRRLARASAEFYRNPPAGFSEHPLLDRTGLFLAARGEYADDLLRPQENDPAEPPPVKVDPSLLYEGVPLLAPGLLAVLYYKDEGVVDVHGILHAFLRNAGRNGAELRTACEAVRLRIAGGKVEGLDTSTGYVAAAQVILAGGGWVEDLAADAGYPLGLTAYRRHLLVTEPQPQVDRRWPVVWILGDDFYFRPESGGLLMCACDAVPVPPSEGETTDSAVVAQIASKAARWLPALADARVARAWAGMRTFPPDNRFVIGPDPRVRGLYWAAGFGGHGITCAPAAGELAAQWVMGGGSEHPSASALAPARLLS